MNIAYSADDNYYTLFHTSVFSLLENNKDVPLRVFLINSGISPENIERAKALFKGKINAKLSVIPIDRLIPPSKLSEKELGGWLPLAAYGRLFLTELPEEIEKIIYLDCDTVICSSIFPLWEKELGDSLYAGVADPNSESFNIEIGKQPDELYVNSGVLLMNLSAMRECGWTDKVLKTIDLYGGDVPWQDQGVVNILGGREQARSFLLEPKYNAMDYYVLFRPKRLEFLGVRLFYTGEEYRQAAKTPVIIHYIACFDCRVWDIRSRHPYKDVFIRYASGSGLKESEYQFKTEDRSFVHTFKAYIARYAEFLYPPAVKLYTLIYKAKH